MGNVERGEVSFEADGKTYKLKFGTHSLCLIEDQTGKSIAEVGKTLENESTATLSLLRIVFWGALQHHHDGLTLKDAAEIIDEIGPSAVGPLIGKAFDAAFPQAKASKANPRKAAASTGRR